MCLTGNNTTVVFLSVFLIFVQSVYTCIESIRERLITTNLLCNDDSFVHLRVERAHSMVRSISHPTCRGSGLQFHKFCLAS